MPKTSAALLAFGVGGIVRFLFGVASVNCSGDEGLIREGTDLELCMVRKVPRRETE